MNIFIELILAYLTTVGFSILFSAPKASVPYAGIAGALAWSLYSISFKISASSILATFIGALTVGILGEFLARILKKPATLFITPGIIPLVPGAGMYYTMLHVIEKDFIMAANKGVETFFIAAAISIGIIISTGFSRSIKRVRFKD